jgi:hypothetical protein
MSTRAGIRALAVGRRVRLADWYAREYGAVGTVIRVTSRGLTVRMSSGITLKRITAADIAAWID